MSSTEIKAFEPETFMELIDEICHHICETRSERLLNRLLDAYALSHRDPYNHFYRRQVQRLEAEVSKLEIDLEFIRRHRFDIAGHMAVMTGHERHHPIAI